MTATLNRHGYSTPTACEMTGLSFRQLDYWDRTDLLHPSIARGGQGSGTGGHRRWSDADIAVLRVIAAMLDLGVSFDLVRRVVPDLVAEPPAPSAFVVATDEGASVVDDLALWTFDRPSVVVPVTEPVASAEREAS